jgi:4-amino-4-deoxy-L-arabinose transferase-like glycosyltransferase
VTVNQLYGILIIVFCFIIYIVSYNYKRKENYPIAVLLLVISGFTLRFFASADFYLHPWDEVFHAVASKHMISHPLIPTLYENPVLPYDYKNWTGNYIWVHKQPLPLWTMALSMYLFGINEIALRLPSIILTSIGIWLTYYIGIYFFDKRTGYLAAFFYSINGLIIEMTAGRIPTDHIDDFFLFFVELSVFFIVLFCQKRNSIFNILAALSLGCAILSKWMPALILFPIWLLLVIDSGKFTPKIIVVHFIILLAFTTVVFLPWQIYIYHTFPIEAKWEAGYNFKHITQVLDQQGGSVYYYLNKIRINYGELIYLPLIWFIWIFYKDLKNLKSFALSFWLFIPLIFFSLIKTKMQGYILFTSPAIFIIAAAFWFMIFDYRFTLDLNKPNNIRLKWFFNLILLALIVLPVRYGIERIKPLQKNRNPQWVMDLKKMGQGHLKKGILLNYSKPIDAMFYTDLSTYPYIPEKNVIQSLIDKGYTVLINDNGNVATDIMSLKGIVPVHLASAN